MAKCSHDSCKNDAENGSIYCNRCIQLPTKLCNFCNSSEPQFPILYDEKHTLMLDILVELIVCLPLSVILTATVILCYMFGGFISQSITGTPVPALAGQTMLELLLMIYLMLFCWVRIGSMNIKWSE